MSQVLHRDRKESAPRDARPTPAERRLRPFLVALIVVVTLLAGVAGGWAALSGSPGSRIEEIQQARAEGMADYHERLWRSRTRPEEVERARAEGMVEYHERLWRSRQADGDGLRG